MKLDIIIVTYNSEKWLKNCVESIEKQINIDLKNINLIFVDNMSKDKTISTLQKYKKKTKLGEFKIIETNKNLGFGKGNNLGFDSGNSEYVLFLNPDTKLDNNCIEELFKGIKNSTKEFSMWEMRQKPYEHPKIYDILTGETLWASGACVTFKREVFKEIGKFDSKIFMYAEDVDVSYKNRAHGYKIKYLPNSKLDHYCYETANQIKPTQYIYSILNNLNLKLRYGSHKEILGWFKSYYKIMTRKGPFKYSRLGSLYRFIKNIPVAFIFYFSRFKYKNFIPDFIGFDYSPIREGAFVKPVEIKTNPLVSIIVRTCGRPEILKECLTSIMNQTYKNVEAVIVEDGKNISEKMIKENFEGKLNYQYYATNTKKERCFTGNMGLEKAKGKYLNFLDDDDLFYPDHVETLVTNLEKEKNYKIAYTYAFAIKVEYQKNYKYEIKDRSSILVRKFNKIDLFHYNLFPIQAVMFEKTVYEKLGGLDLEMRLLEDWELWQRYALEYDYLLIPKTTSEFKVPFNQEVSEKRNAEMLEYLEKAHKKIRNKKWDVTLQEVLEQADTRC